MIETRKKKAGTIIITIAAIMLMMPVAVMAGNLEPGGPPDNGTMHTLEEIYTEIETLKTNQAVSNAKIVIRDLIQGQ
jgi:hypothetical protein